MAEKKKAAPKKKAASKKKAAPKKPAIPQIVVDFCEVPAEEINETVLAAAHTALWGAQWKTIKEEKVLVAIQQLRGKRRPF